MRIDPHQIDGHRAAPIGAGAVAVRVRRGGAVLMEVVIATALFFVAGIFVMDGLNSAIRGVTTIKLEADATDLAVTTYSEVQMGLTPLQSVGPVGVAYSGAEGWTYELIVSAMEDTLDMPQLKKLEIVVRHDASDFTHRTTHLVWDNPNPLPAVPGVDQVPSDLAGLNPSDVAGAAGGAGAGSTAGRPTTGRGSAPDATPQFPPRGNPTARTPDATSPFPGGGNRGNGGNATPQFPPRGNGGNSNNPPNATPQFPPRGNGGNGNNPPADATPRFPQGGNNKGKTGDATPRFPQGGNNKGKTGDATPRFPQGGNQTPPPPPPPPADAEEDETKDGGAP